MFNYLKKYNIFCCSKLFVVLYAVSMFSISAEAKICFLPDSSCGTGKISSVKPNPAQCLYSSMAQAQNGMLSCEKAYKQNFCFYRRCKTREEDKNVFSNYSDCQKALEDNQTCQSCGGCYKIVTSPNPTPNNKTCNETEATCSAKGKAFEANGEYDSNNVACGSCTVIETCPSGYSTAYQSQKDCKTGETFSSNGTANGKVCGKCTKVIECKDYTLTSAKDKNCYSCSTCPTDSSKYKCTESVKSGYQLVGNSCVNKCSDYTLTSKKDENCYSCTPCPYDSSKYKCTENVKSNYQLVNGVCSKKPTENCSKYSVAPWVVNGADNSVKCRAINSSYVPCGEKATCGGTQYVECKNSSQCGNGGGSTGDSCTASTYTASVTCSLSYRTDECCSAFGCSGKGCGTGYYNCVFDVPSCAFSSVSIHATDTTNQDRIVASAGAGKTTRVLNNYQIPGPHTPCEFFVSSSSLGKVNGEAVSGQSYTWKCSYTRKIR